MPDAIITSTESTFGTISGTFAADQSTISGTVTGIVAGTLSGSVGVPGPAGAAGAPGQGVPAGGASGQYLQKTSGADYATDWVTVNLAAYAVKANNLSDLTNFTTARDNLALGTANTPTFAGVNVPGSGTSVANLGATSLTINQSGHGQFTIQPSQGIVFPNGTIQTTAFTGGAAYISSVSSPLTVTSGNLSIDLSAYLTTSTAASTYYPLTNPSAYITASALTPYLTTSTASATYQTLAGMSSYLTTSAAASTYQTLAGMSAYLTTASAATSYYPLTGNPSGFLTSAPVTSVAGRTGAITLSNTDISGLGTLAVVNDAPSDGSQYARKNGAWDIVSAGSSYISSVSSPLSVTSGNLSIDLSTYLLSSTAASTYAPIAAGLPTGGTVGQILTKQSGTNFDASFQTLIPGDRYLTSSTTSNTIGNGNKTFTIGTGLSYTPTQNITISYDASNHMHGEVLTYNSGTGVLTVDINHHTGAGTYASWVVNVGGVTPATSVAWGAITGTLSSQTDLATALNAKLETSTAASTYAPIASPTFTGTVTIPAGASISGYLTSATAASTYQTISGMSSYLTTSAAATTYYPLTGNPSGFLTSAPVTSVAGKTGAVTLVVGDVSNAVSVDGTQTISGAKTFTNANLTIGNSTSAGTIAIASGSNGSGVLKSLYLGTGGNTGSSTDIIIGANLGSSSITLQGNAYAVTLPVDSNSTLLATTAFVVGQAGSATPLVNGTAAVGTSLRYARQDHVHGTDTSRAPLASPTFTGTVTIPAGASITGYATESYVTSQGYITSSALTPYLTSATAASTYQTISGMSSYLTTSTAASTYQTISGMSSYLTTASAASTYAPLASPALTGVPTAPTAANGTNTTQVATTAFVLANGGAVTSVAGRTGAVTLSNTDISGLGTMAVETATNYLTTASASATYFTIASAANKADLASPTFTGAPLSTTAAADTNTTQLATTAYVVGQASSSTPANDGTAAIGTSLKYARADHVHGTDTSRAPLASPTFTGTVTIPAGASISGFAPLASPTFTGTPTLPTGTIAVTQTAGNNTTAVATTAFVRADNNVKAWVNFNGSGTVSIRGSFNVSSITDNAVGDYTINFSTSMTDTNYAPISSGQLDNTPSPAGDVITGSYRSTTSRTVSSYRTSTVNSAGSAIDPVAWYLAIIR